ncbi:hypothetical protein DXT94_15655 [Rhizobium sp. ICMP 5592]|nr:hypothetical protein [Rhizobium sp. ICMP 5592]
MTLPASASKGAKCLQRNREVSVQLMLLALAESNRGTDLHTIVEAVAGAAAEFMYSFLLPFSADDQEHLVDHFQMAFDKILEHAFTKGPIGAVGIELPSEQGGHA